MKKSLIALAVLAAAGAASAQSSVTLFGIVDAAVQVGRGNVSNKIQLGSGAYNTSRLGFRGTEDLGGGMSASFWLEAGINADNGTGAATNTNNQPSGCPVTPGTSCTGAAVGAGSQGLTFNRRSTVSLAGGWGELRLGRDLVPQMWNLVAFDPMGIVGVGVNQMYASIITPSANSNRASNSIGYFLPGKLGGFYGQFMHYRGENNSGTLTSKDGTGNGIRVGFASGPFNVALATGKTEYFAGDVKQSNLGGQWDFGVGKLQAQFSKDKNGSLDGEGYLVGGSFPIGAGEIRTSFSRYETDAFGKPVTKKLALGYVHNLSKRTAVYTTYARVKNNGGAAFALNGAVTSPNSSSSGLDLGIRHSF